MYRYVKVWGTLLFVITISQTLQSPVTYIGTYAVQCTKCSGNNRFEIWSFCYPVLCTCDMFMGDCCPKTNVRGARWHAHARTPLMRQQQRATSCNAARCNYARRTISLRLFLDIHGTH